MGRRVRLLPYITAIGLLVAAVVPTWAQTSTGSSQTYVVANTEGAGVNFRSSPGGTDIGSWPEGARMTEIGEMRQASGRNWRNVRAPDGTTGWVAADFLVVAGAPSPSTAPSGSQSSSDALVVGKTDGQNAVLRDVPGGLQIGSYPEGTSMTLVTSEVRSTGDRDWRNVRGPDGEAGWMASVLLSGGGGAVAGGTGAQPSSSAAVVASNPYSITADMRARALAARARAIPVPQRRTAVATATRAPSGTATRTPTATSTRTP